MDNQSPNFDRIVRVSLFIVSYAPLFILVIVKQTALALSTFSMCADPMTWAIPFAMPAFLLLLICFGSVSTFLTLRNLETLTLSNGDIATIKSMNNKNSESISYIGTYILPFLFEDFSSVKNIISFVFLLYVIYRIYIKSSLMLVNPFVNIKYHIFEVEFMDHGSNVQRSGLALFPGSLEEGNVVKIYRIGHKLYFIRRTEDKAA
ncbi:MAG: hypothetical protein JNM27_08635 [Leptospirales bacterium]|nr:hypothetical protein [Leptospirales bacterium]